MLITGVVSRDRCNTGLQSIRRSFKSQCFSWPLIEAQGDLVQVRLRVAGQIRLLRQVLPQQPVRVFVRTALPWALGIAEVLALGVSVNAGMPRAADPPLGAKVLNQLLFQRSSRLQE